MDEKERAVYVKSHMNMFFADGKINEEVMNQFFEVTSKRLIEEKRCDAFLRRFRKQFSIDPNRAIENLTKEPSHIDYLYDFMTSR